MKPYDFLPIPTIKYYIILNDMVLEHPILLTVSQWAINNTYVASDI